MKKIILTFITTVFLLVGFGNLGVFSAGCGINANVGSTQSGSGFLVNTNINTDGLDETKTYILVENISGHIDNHVVKSFSPPSTRELQISFDATSGSTGDKINLWIEEAGVEAAPQICSYQTTLQTSSAPNSYNNLPVNPGSNSATCSGGTGINTAIGCIPFGDHNQLIGFFLKWGIGIGGGIAFLLILAAGFQIMTSRGDPKRLQAGQELMTSAIAGLLLLIFSVVILRIIGFDIFNISAFK